MEMQQEFADIINDMVDEIVEQYKVRYEVLIGCTHNCAVRHHAARLQRQLIQEKARSAALVRQIYKLLDK